MHLNLKPGQLPIFITNIVALIIFSIIFFSKKNFEFIYYIGVIVFFLLLILYTNNRVNFPNVVLWGLTLWSILHMSGGSIMINGDVLYNLILINLIGEPYHILKYDQFVHIVGFGAATLTMFYLLKPQLKKNPGMVSTSIVVVMAGLGVGAVNEIVEFFATVIIPNTNVGGYINTSLDLVADLIGGLLALLFILKKEKP